jgi:hypothetical protein
MNMPGFAPATPNRLIEQDPRGRFDVIAALSARKIVNGIEQRTGVDLWNRGLGDVIEAFIGDYVPSHPYTAVEVARNLGILKKQPRIKGAK